jgi:hypothetical protein
MAPLQLWGIRGKKITHSFGWEVLVKSHRLESKSYMERMGQQLRAGDLGYGMVVFILHGRLLFALHFHL